MDGIKYSKYLQDTKACVGLGDFDYPPDTLCRFHKQSVFLRSCDRDNGRYLKFPRLPAKLHYWYIPWSIVLDTVDFGQLGTFTSSFPHYPHRIFFS